MINNRQTVRLFGQILSCFILTPLIASGEHRSRNCSAGRHRCHTANQAYTPPMGVLLPQPTALRWFQAAGALPEPWIIWLRTQRFPAISRASLQLSYFCAKYPLLIEKVLLNVYECKAIENWGSKGEIALSSWNPELWAMLMGVVWAQKKCKGSRTAPSVVSKEQPELAARHTAS